MAGGGGGSQRGANKPPADTVRVGGGVIDGGGGGDTPDDTTGTNGTTDADLARLEMEEALEELPATARSSLLWFDPASSSWVDVCSLTADQVRRDFIRENFGGGKFKGRFRVGREWGRVWSFTIDPMIPRRIPSWLMTPAERAAAGNGPGAVPSSDPPARRSRNDDDGTADMQMLIKTQILDLVRAGQDQRNAAQESQTAMMTAVMSMIKGMSESTAALVTSIAGARRNENSITLADVMKLLETRNPGSDAIVKALESSRGKGGDMDSIEKALALIDRLRGKRRAHGDDDDDGDGDDDPMIGIARDLLPPLVKALTGETIGTPGGQPPALPPGSPPDAPPAGAPPAAGGAQPPAPPVNPNPTPIDMAYTAILEAAQEGQDPTEFGISLLQMTPRIFRGKVREFVMQPDAVPTIVTTYPALAQYQTWVAQCIESIRAEFTPPEDAPPA